MRNGMGTVGRMKTRSRIAIGSLVAVVAVIAVGANGCALTSHAVQRSTLGTPKSSADLLAVIDQPGELTVETINSADWAVDRAGLINLDSPVAKQAGLTAGDEPIQIYFHVIRHPTKGTFIVDTGVEKAMRDAPNEAALSGVIISAFLHPEKMKFKMPLGDWVAAHPGEPLKGVFLTHLHADHISGMRDVPKGTPLYNGAGEAEERSAQNIVIKGVTNAAFEGQAPLSEWQFEADPSGRFDGVLDVFGDGQLWAIRTPGHTVGATSYLARTKDGPVLMTGDTCHTAWGWEHEVEPGGFTADQAKNLQSLKRLRTLAQEHPFDVGAAGSPDARRLAAVRGTRVPHSLSRVGRLGSGPKSQPREICDMNRWHHS